MNLPDWQNLNVLGRNRLPAHATLIPFESEKKAVQGERGLSDYFKLLSGTWDFKYAAYPCRGVGSSLATTLKTTLIWTFLFP